MGAGKQKAGGSASGLLLARTLKQPPRKTTQPAATGNPPHRSTDRTWSPPGQTGRLGGNPSCGEALRCHIALGNTSDERAVAFPAAPLDQVRQQGSADALPYEPGCEVDRRFEGIAIGGFLFPGMGIGVALKLACLREGHVPGTAPDDRFQTRKHLAVGQRLGIEGGRRVFDVMVVDGGHGSGVLDTDWADHFLRGFFRNKDKRKGKNIAVLPPLVSCSLCGWSSFPACPLVHQELISIKRWMLFEVPKSSRMSEASMRVSPVGTPRMW